MNEQALPTGEEPVDADTKPVFRRIAYSCSPITRKEHWIPKYFQKVNLKLFFNNK